MTNMLVRVKKNNYDFRDVIFECPDVRCLSSPMTVMSIKETATKGNCTLPIWLLFALYGHSATHNN